MELFFDTSAIFAWFSPRDGNYRKASEYIRSFRAGKTGFKILLITDAIFTEVADLTQIKLGKREAIRIGDVLQQSKIIEIADTTSADRIAAWEIMKKYADQNSNFTDAVSFAVMNRLGLDTAFTFDQHFKIHGYNIVP